MKIVQRNQSFLFLSFLFSGLNNDIDAVHEDKNAGKLLHGFPFNRRNK